MEYLVHHGIKGQKWGVRNDPEPSGTIHSRARKVATGAALVIGGAALATGGGLAAKGIISGFGAKNQIRKGSASIFKVLSNVDYAKTAANSLKVGKTTARATAKTAKFVGRTSSGAAKAVYRTKAGRRMVNDMAVVSLGVGVAAAAGAYNRRKQEYTLMHHGIKGQKWGVRRYQDYDGSLKGRVKKFYTNKDGTINKKRVAGTVAVGAGVATGLLVGQGLARNGGIGGAKKILTKTTKYAPVDMNGNKQLILKKGTQTSHLYNTKNLDSNNAEFQKLKRIYATTNKRDDAAYRTWLRTAGEGKKAVVNYEVKRDAVFPTDRQADIINRTFIQRKDIKDNLSFYKGQKDSYHIARAVQEEMAKNPNGYVAKEYYNHISKRGYDGIQDYIDKGSLGKTPVVFANTSILRENGRRYITKKDQVKDLVYLAFH